MVWLTVVVVVILVVLVAGALFFMLYRRATSRWPHPPYRSPEASPKPDEWGDEGLYIAWIGHSTLLIRMDGVNIITDPVFSERVGVSLPLCTIGPRRHVAPALALAQCPPVDVVLLSHAHMDHFDYPSLRHLIGPQTQVVTAANTARLIRRFGPRGVFELEPGQAVELDCGVTITGQRVKHWGSRFPWNRDQGYQGYVIQRGDWCVFFAGDTALTSEMEAVAKFQPQVTCMPIGAYAPETFQGAHCTPEQAWEMFLATGAQHLIPIHHDTFVLSQEPLDEPINRLLRAASAREEVIALTKHGETFALTRQNF
ncbi:MBL fold metallo-hydrolase [Alicyclobacillus fastidiosus]|uniref:MBL fold metallo-hydrolase n=1 Tax=Alicyclobacillus fastidiosus TaxID=392011 RepID=A0ABY6ZD52_9BACL|nr:MBL fold metallo-hydrolase [Alicyclobacillus fastidiosus]WAH40786.1 MBL fold metallo-hydrolase [Alicyclobacillus fastidiosus]